MTLSTPLLWVVLPLVIAVLCGVFYQRRFLGIMLAGGVTLGLGLLAAFFPEDMLFSIGPLELLFEESLNILGRQIILSYEILPFIAFVYITSSLWHFSSGFPGTPITFRPSSLVITALLTAALGVEPFLYAALLIQMAVMASIPMLSPINEKLSSGILRYLSLQTLAMPFVLLAGWLLTGVESVPPDSPLIFQSMALLGIGFTIWLSVFPFHSWVPMVCEKSRPIVFSYLLFIMPTTILVFSLNFFERYSFLRSSEDIYEVLRLIGVLMVVFGGFLTAYQTHLKRAFGFSVLTETGFSILCLGFANQGGLNWMFIHFPARALGFLLWGYILARMENTTGHLDLKNLAGFARQYPIVSSGLLLAQLSIAGLPLLASFPVKGNLMAVIYEAGTGLGAWTFIGSLGLFVFSLRLLSALVTNFEGEISQSWKISEKAREYIPILLMVLGLLWMGLFPGKLLSGLGQTLLAFPQLQ